MAMTLVNRPAPLATAYQANTVPTNASSTMCSVRKDSSSVPMVPSTGIAGTSAPSSIRNAGTTATAAMIEQNVRARFEILALIRFKTQCSETTATSSVVIPGAVDLDYASTAGVQFTPHPPNQQYPPGFLARYCW